MAPFRPAFTNALGFTGGERAASTRMIFLGEPRAPAEGRAG